MDINILLFALLINKLKEILCLQVIVGDTNTMFVENIIFIMKNILENKTEQPCEHLGITSIESLMLAVVRSVLTAMLHIVLSLGPGDNSRFSSCCFRYVRHLDSSIHAIQIKTKLCQLVEAVSMFIIIFL